MNKNVVLHHGGGCQDGFAAAWCAWHYFGEQAEYIPVNYGQSLPDAVDGNAVTLLDFSYKAGAMRELADRALSLVVLDHHASAANDLKVLHGYTGKVSVTFDLERSGCRLAWDHFFPDKPAPWFIDYAQDRDLWQWKLPFSKEINAAMASYPHDFKLWDRWAGVNNPVEQIAHKFTRGTDFGEDLIRDMIREGTAILRYQQQMADAACKNAVEIELDGHKVLSTNATMLISEIGQKLCKDRPFSATYFIRSSDGKKIWSLRSEDGGLNVSEIAKRHGGGGHPHAAGYQE